jgi:hypothetical protein
MNRDTLIHELSELNVVLSAPLSESERANGWTLESQQATLQLLGEIMTALRENRDLPAHLSLGRGLDHWGVEGGPLFEKTCAVSNHLRQLKL